MFQVFLGVPYVCLQVFLWMLHMFAMVFKYFSDVFVSGLDVCFKCFIYLLLYVATVASGYFKSRSDVTHGMRVGSGWRRTRPSGRYGPTVGALAREPDALGARSLASCADTVRTLAMLFFIW